MRALCLTLVSVAVLSGCEGGGDPVAQALREAATARQAATVTDGAVATTDRPRVSPDDQVLVARMIDQQRAGIATADTVLARSSDPDVRRMARAIKDRQTREITEMQAWSPATN